MFGERRDTILVYILKLFFSFSGKIKRSEFWLAWFVTIGLWITAAYVSPELLPESSIVGIFDMFIWFATSGLWIILGIGNTFESSVGMFVMFIVLMWSGLAIQVKRWHKRNESGFSVLINIIPFVGPILSLIVLGFLPENEVTSNNSKARAQQSEEYSRRSQEAEFKQQKQRRMAEEARRFYEENAKRRVHAEHQSEKHEQSAPPPMSEEIRFAKILDLNGKVSKDDIKNKYRDLVHKYHPDKVSHLGNEFKELAEIKFKELNEAYEYFRRKYGIK